MNTQKDMNERLEIIVLDSLAKVFADQRPGPGDLLKDASMLRNEVFSFQAAVCWNDFLLKDVNVEIVSDLAAFCTIYSVGLVPSELPCYPDHDEDVLRATPGLYPDPLYKLGNDFRTDFLPAQWRSYWIEIDLKGCSGDLSGPKDLQIRFSSSAGVLLGSAKTEIRVINAFLPGQKLIYTDWLHADCISTYYEVEVWSERHWDLLGKYISEACGHGMNMLLTPVFTPPLDTLPGGERPTVQLVDVYRSKDGFRFGFDRLGRWFDLALSCGICYFEISHLFTQWGAKHAPKIICSEDGQPVQIFGWDTDAAGKEYTCFLRSFLPALMAYIRSKGLEGRCFYHVSDEPCADHIDSYSAASSVIRELAGDAPVIDALSDLDFYSKDLIAKPIPATDHIEPFLSAGIDDLWTYYCCGQYKGVSNRFFDMPSSRNRILGLQLYKFNIEGFLHWGYNFWYTQFSARPVDPYKVTDAGYAFPSGDAFCVYPGENGPVPSLRLKVFREALQDMQAAKLLESLIGREKVLEIIEEHVDGKISFDSYPRDAAWLLEVRERINEEIGRTVRT